MIAKVMQCHCGVYVLRYLGSHALPICIPCDRKFRLAKRRRP